LRKRTKNKIQLLKDIGITAAIFAFSCAVGILLQEVFAIHDHITTVFIFSAFLASLLTDGYVYGIAITVVNVFFINYAFTTPFYDFDFTIPQNILSALIMLIISLCTSTLTTQLKRWQEFKARGEREMMRANLMRAVSHDLRTPLTTIYGSSSALIESSDTLTDSQREAMLKSIREDSEWLIRIVENLLSVTKLGGAGARIIKSPTVLDELVDSVIVKFNKRYPSQKIEIKIPDDITVIPMDPLLIEQVLINMLDNAVKHARGMTKLALEVTLDTAAATFSVIDNGCGVDKARLDRIFEDRYGDGGFPIESDGKNSGIGLSVCATIIKAHEGTIRAENRKGGGAVFSFTLSL